MSIMDKLRKADEWLSEPCFAYFKIEGTPEEIKEIMGTREEKPKEICGSKPKLIEAIEAKCKLLE